VVPVQIQGVERGAVRTVIILRPKIEVRTACRWRCGTVHVAREQPVANVGSQSHGWDEKRDYLRVGITGERLSTIERIGADTRKWSGVQKFAGAKIVSIRPHPGFGIVRKIGPSRDSITKIGPGRIVGGSPTRPRDVAVDGKGGRSGLATVVAIPSRLLVRARAASSATQRSPILTKNSRPRRSRKYSLGRASEQ
jgi:hypothetical protein